MKVIKSLTPEQEAEIPKFIEKWVKQASEPTDREVATEAIKQLYKNAGEEEPLVIYGRSPNEAILMALTVFGIVKDYDWSRSQLDSQLHSQLRSQLDSQLNSQLHSQLSSQLYSQLHSQLHSQLYSQLDSQLHSQLHSQLYSQLYSQLSSQLHSQLNSQLDSESDETVKKWLQSIKSNFYVSVWWLVYCGWCDFGQYIGVEFDKEKYDLFVNFNKNIGFFLPYKGIVFISDNATNIRWEENLLHFDAGKAVEYADGWGTYQLRGLNLDETTYKKITSGKMTAEDVMQIEDVDIREVAYSMLGAKEMIKGLKAELVHTGEKGNKLYICKNFRDTGTNEYLLWMKDASTPREFVHFIAPGATKEYKEAYTNADIATAWMIRDADGNSIPIEDYHLLQPENEG